MSLFTEIQALKDDVQRGRQLVEECLNASNFLVSKGSTPATIRIQKEVCDLESMYEVIRCEILTKESEIEAYILKTEKCNKLLQVSILTFVNLWCLPIPLKHIVKFMYVISPSVDPISYTHMSKYLTLSPSVGPIYLFYMSIHLTLCHLLKVLFISI